MSDLLIRHYASLAESGVAMVVVANASVSADMVVAVNNLRIDRDDFIPALARLARAIQQRGALAVLQLNVLQGKEVEARRRWDEIRRILGWEEQVALRMVPSMGNVAGDILRELRAGGHGTLVMGKRGLSRMKRLFLGSVSAAVLQGLDTKTLILID